MGDSPRPTRLICFEGFRVDCQSGELYRNGQKAKLSGQPFEVLAMLLQRPGQLVTREELRKRLWREDTFVDFDHSLNTAINKIREALGDSAENPHFVETLPRRGYRFIARVEGSAAFQAAPEEAGKMPALQNLAPRVGTPPLQVGADSARPREGRALPYTRWAVVGFSALVLVTAVLVLGLNPAGLRDKMLTALGARRAPSPEAPLSATPLTTYPGVEYDPSFSPDGTQVAFSWNGKKQDNFDIYVKLIGSEPPLRLTKDPAEDCSPAWSPDGRWIAFLRVLPASEAAIILVSPIGGPERTLTEVSFSRVNTVGPYLAWSVDSRWLAVVGNDGIAGRHALFLYSVETGEGRRLTSPPADRLGDDCPAFSPDGRKLAFIRSRSWGQRDVCLLDLSQDLQPVGAPRQLVSSIWFTSSPVWTVGGKSLVYTTGDGVRKSGLWRIDVSGSNGPQHLAEIGVNPQRPAISRDGTRLAYAEYVYDPDIWRMEIPASGVKGRPPEKFISSTKVDHQPQFSPDGKKIAFRSTRSGNDEVWVCDADGSNAVQLTFQVGEIAGPPRWSPNSRRLTFSATIEGRSDVYVLNAGGGRPRRLTSNHAESANPSWSRDGRWILFDSSTAPAGILKIPAEGGPAVLVASKAGGRPVESFDGKSIYTTANTADGFSLIRISTERGEPQQVLDSLADFQSYEIVEDGIYFVPRPEPNSGYSIQFLNTASGKIHRVATLEKPVALSLTVSPDRRWILFTQVEQSGSDLMLIENFR